MWLLKGDNDGKLFYLKPDKTMTVGRNKGDIVLSDDGSISRVHAQIIIKPSLQLDKITDKTQPLSLCTIKDPGSKYGNFILHDNDEVTRISDEGHQLQHMDRIRFGLQNYIFTVHYIPIITVTSGMSANEKEKLEKVMEEIDGKISYAWSALCSHMTVERPTISEKLSCALASQMPIVSMDYWNEFAKAVAENKELPEVTAFAASVDAHFREIRGKSVTPNIARQTLFENLTFVHFNTKQFALYARMIKLAGGKSIQYGKQRIIPDVCDDNVIVVQFVESNTTQATHTGDAKYAAVCEKLSRCRRRTIPESEIPIAILHCSIEKYCNPRFDYAALFKNKSRGNVPQTGTVLALDTQDLLPPQFPAPNQVRAGNYCVPETIDESCNVESAPTRNYRNNIPRGLVTSEKSRGEIFSGKVEKSLTEDSAMEVEMESIKVASINHENYLRDEFDRIATEKDPGKRIHENDEEEYERKKKICLDNASVLSINSRKSHFNGVSESLECSIPDDKDPFFRDEEQSVEKKRLDNKREKPNILNFFTKDKELEKKPSSIMNFFSNEREAKKKQEQRNISSSRENEKESEKRLEKQNIASSFFANRKETEKKRDVEVIANSSDDEEIMKENTEKRSNSEKKKKFEKQNIALSVFAKRKETEKKPEVEVIANSSEDEKMIEEKPEKTNTAFSFLAKRKEAERKREVDVVASSSEDEKVIKENAEKPSYGQKEKKLEKQSVVSDFFGKRKEMEKKREIETIASSSGDEEIIKEKAEKPSYGQKEKKLEKQSVVSDFFGKRKEMEKKREVETIASSSGDEEIIKEKAEKPSYGQKEKKLEKQSVVSDFFGKRKEMEKKREIEIIASSSEDEEIMKENKTEKHWSSETEKRKIITMPGESPSSDVAENPRKKPKFASGNVGRNDENPKKEPLSDSASEYLHTKVIKEEEISWIEKMEALALPDDQDTAGFLLRKTGFQRTQTKSGRDVNKRFNKQILQIPTRMSLDTQPLPTTLSDDENPPKGRSVYQNKRLFDSISPIHMQRPKKIMRV